MAKKILAGLVLVVVGLFAAPLAANAADYVPRANITVSGNAVPGGTVNVNFSNGSFTANETVHVTVDGSGTVTIAQFKAATVSADKTASSGGALSVAVTLPSDATGSYTVTATGATSGIPGSATFTVHPADAGGGVGSAAGSGSGSGLADTGSTVSILAFWFAGGIVLLGAAFVAVRIIVRRQTHGSNA